MTGDPIPVLDDVFSKPFTDAANYAVSQTGRLVYGRMAGDPGFRGRLTWIDREGRSQSLPADRRPYHGPRVSPDGTELALFVSGERAAGTDLWVWDFARESLSPLTFGEAIDEDPLWAPDGISVLYRSKVPGVARSYVMRRQADGSGDADRLLEDPVRDLFSMSRDGEWLIHRQEGTRAVVASSLKSGETLELPLSEATVRNVELSPDGQWLAYESNESESFEVYVRLFPAVDEGRWQISTGGGREAAWSRDGKELFYISPEGNDGRCGRSERL